MKYTTFLGLVALLPASVLGHIGFWHESCYGCAASDGYDPVTPLAEMSFNEWWFHGAINKPPASGTPPFVLPSGGTATAELSCRRKYTSMETRTPGTDPCPTDEASMHAGTPLRDSQLLGCGLAIAYKSDITTVQPSDFVIFTVNHSCVKTLQTEFQIPAGMPECPGGKCICAWFWQGQNSANEMYMTGFDCTVTNASPTAKLAAPKPASFCRDEPEKCVKGAKQPHYWANDAVNVQMRGYEFKPSYDLSWGFQDGAQNDIFASGTSPAPVVAKPVASPSPIIVKPILGGNKPAPVQNPDPIRTTLSTSTRSSSSAPLAQPSPVRKGKAPVTVTVTENKTVYSTIYSTITGSGAQPTRAVQDPKSCTWKGHCEGAVCARHEDCSDDLACFGGRCAPPKRRVQKRWGRHGHVHGKA